MTTDPRAHIDAERLAAWADHGLSAAAAAEVELHLSQCERCQEVLAAFVRSEPAPAVVIPFFARRPVRWGAAGLAAAAAVFLIVRTQLPTVPVPDSVVAREETSAKAIPGPPEPRADTAPAPTALAPADLKRERRSNRVGERDAKSTLADSKESPRAAANEESVRKEQPARAAMPAPPPTAPPAATVVGGTAARVVSGNPTVSESVVRDSTRGVIEIVAPGPAALRRLAAAAGRADAALSEFRQQTAPARWRIVAGTRVDFSLDAGATWTVLSIEPSVTTPLAAGVAAGPSVCWLVGSEGVVLVTTDGRTFRRVLFPERVQLVSVTAEDSLQATVTAADGRKFSTIDGGLTWK